MAVVPSSSTSFRPRIPQITVDTSAVPDIVLRNISAGNPGCKVCDDKRRGDCAPSALGHIFQTTMADLDKSANSDCSLCKVLLLGCRHFSHMFRPDWAPEKVKIQYSENLSELLYVRDRYEARKTYCEILVSFEGLDMAPIQLLLSPQERRNPPIGIGRRWHHQPEHSYPELASVWLERCRSHPECNPVSVSLLPTRVLAVGGSKVRLYESRREQAAYVALSHCWGEGVRLTTTSSSLYQRKRGIPWDELPRTFQDAITMTRKLGVLYIWIDSLCIIQDSKTDWEIESTRMASVYRNACLTIAASGALNGDSGLFNPLFRAPYVWRSFSGHPSFLQVNNADLWKPYAIECGRGDCSLSRLIHDAYKFDKSDKSDKDAEAEAKTGCHYIAMEPSHDILNHDRRSSADDIIWQGLPLFTRAWFLQERILSPRILHFGQMEMYWECRQGIWCECLAIREDRREFVTRNAEMNAGALYNTVHSSSWKKPLTQQDLFRGAFSDPNCQDKWQMIVEEYSRLRLSHEMDRLPALSGIADCGEGSTQYLAGLWQKHLPAGLCWTVDHNSSTPVHRPAIYRAPSFSWAAIDGPINFPKTAPLTEMHPNCQTYIATVLEAECKQEGLDPRGRVVDGYLKVEGWLGTAVVRHLSRDASMKPMCEIHCQSAKLAHSFPLDLPLNTVPAEVSLGQELTLLLLRCDKARFNANIRIDKDSPGYYYHVIAVVLKPSKKDPNSYERVGLVWPTEEDLRNVTTANLSNSHFKLRGMFTNAPQWFNRKTSIKIV